MIFESVRAHAKTITIITASVGFGLAGMESGIRMDKGVVSRMIDAQLTRGKELILELRMPLLHYQISYLVRDYVDEVRYCAC